MGEYTGISCYTIARFTIFRSYDCLRFIPLYQITMGYACFYDYQVEGMQSGVEGNASQQACIQIMALPNMTVSHITTLLAVFSGHMFKLVHTYSVGIFVIFNSLCVPFHPYQERNNDILCTCKHHPPFS